MVSSTARVTLKFGKIPLEAFFAGAANVIFRHASTGVWVKEVREYASTRVRAREKLVDPVWFDNQGWEQYCYCILILYERLTPNQGIQG
jgi:hypothetical protein